MASQLTLIAPERQWRLDRKTCETGRKGLAQARAALQAHRPTEPQRHRAA